MLISDMLSRVRKGLDDRASDYTDVDLKKIMQMIWQYHLPYRIDPASLSNWRALYLKPGQATYGADIAADVLWPFRLIHLEKMWYNTTLEPITIWTDRWAYDSTPVNSANVLWQDRYFTFRRTPVVDGVATVQGKYSNAAFDEVNGIGNDEWALAVTRGAVLDIATQEGWSDIMLEYAQFYEGSIKILRGVALAEPRTHEARPDL